MVTLLLSLVTGTNARADVTYTITKLGSLGPGPNYGMSVNASGQVAGYSDPTADQPHATVTGAAGRGVSDLGSLGGGTSYGHGINDSGETAGFSTGPGGFIHGFVTTPGGLRDLGTLGGTTSFAFGINNAGQVTGSSTLTVAGVLQTHAFVTAPGGGGMHDLGTLAAGSYSSGYAINEAGQVTGYSYLSGATGYFHAFLTVNGAMKDLGTLAGGTSSVGQAVNDSGQVAGVSYFKDGSFRAFLSEASGGKLHDLGSLTPGGNSYAYGVDDAGVVVGCASVAGGGMDAFVYHDGKMDDLNNLVPLPPGVHLTVAMGISDAGWIIALGIDPFGETSSYLLHFQPIPEPRSLALLALGLAGCGARTWARRRRDTARLPS